MTAPTPVLPDMGEETDAVLLDLVSDLPTGQRVDALLLALILECA